MYAAALDPAALTAKCRWFLSGGLEQHNHRVAPMLTVHLSPMCVKPHKRLQHPQMVYHLTSSAIYPFMPLIPKPCCHSSACTLAFHPATFQAVIFQDYPNLAPDAIAVITQLERDAADAAEDMERRCVPSRVSCSICNPLGA